MYRMAHKQNASVSDALFTDIEVTKGIFSDSEDKGSVEELEVEGQGKGKAADPEDSKMKTCGKKRHSDGTIVNEAEDREMKTPSKKHHLDRDTVVTAAGNNEVKTSCTKYHLDGDIVKAAKGGEMKTLHQKHHLDGCGDSVGAGENSEVKSCKKHHSDRDNASTDEDNDLKTCINKFCHSDADSVVTDKGGHNQMKTVCKTYISKELIDLSNGDNCTDRNNKRWGEKTWSAEEGNPSPQQFETSPGKKQLSTRKFC